MLYTTGVPMKEGTTYPQEHQHWHRCLVGFVGTTYPPGTHALAPVLSGVHVAQSFVF